VELVVASKTRTKLTLKTHTKTSMRLVKMDRN